MYKDRKVLGLIPARGGSKGLPRKNVLKVAGKPLIAWSIESALGARHLDRVVVSTDDEEIASIAREYGAYVPFTRPAEISGDKTPMIDVVVHALDFFKGKGISFDYVALLEPTSPLRKTDDIDNAVEQMISREAEADSLVSLGEVHLEHPAIMKRFDGKYLMPYEKLTETISRRQDLDKVFFPYGVIYLSKTGRLIETGTFYQDRTVPYFIERWQNYEIDDLYDMLCIEAVLNYRLKTKG